MGRYEDLVAYREAAALADDLRAAVRAWTALDQWTVGAQLIRAADAVGANIAEGYGRGTLADERRFLLFARGAAYETQHWIERAFSRSLLVDDSFRCRAAMVGRLLNGLMRAHRKQGRATSD